MKHFFSRAILFTVLVITFCAGMAQKIKYFNNPLLPMGPDPWSIYKDGFYFYTHTTQNNITIYKTKDITNLKNAKVKVVWIPPKTGMYSKQLWAPELHFFNNQWYIYFAADSGRNEDHRLYVLENSSPDPQKGKWIMKGKLTTPEDKWSIDGSVFTNKGKLYLIWSGWAGDVNGRQDIYITKMKNPWTVTGKRTLLSKPDLEWEKFNYTAEPNNELNNIYVNEGPQILQHKNKIFLIYSGSGCWTEHYALGMLTASGNSDLLDAKAWTKSQQPVFHQSPENNIYATGHNSFFKSPDGKEDWILFHANSKSGQGCGDFRAPYAQKIEWDANDCPDFGIPLSTKNVLTKPSGLK